VSPTDFSTASASGSVSKLIHIVKFTGERHRSGVLKYTVQQSLSIRLPVKRLTTAELTKEVSTRLQSDGITESIILLDACTNPISRNASVDEFKAPGKKLLASTVRHYERHVGVGSASKTLKDKLVDSPLKKEQVRGKKAAVKTLEISDSEDDSGTEGSVIAEMMQAIRGLEKGQKEMAKMMKAILVVVEDIQSTIPEASSGMSDLEDSHVTRSSQVVDVHDDDNEEDGGDVHGEE